MSWQATEYVRALRCITSTEKLVALCLALRHRVDQPAVEASAGELSDETGLGRRTIQRTLASLASKNLLTVSRRRDEAGDPGTNLYQFPRLPASGGVASPRRHPGVTTTPPGSVTVTPGGATMTLPAMANGARGGVTVTPPRQNGTAPARAGTRNLGGGVTMTLGGGVTVAPNKKKRSNTKSLAKPLSTPPPPPLTRVREVPDALKAFDAVMATTPGYDPPAPFFQKLLADYCDLDLVEEAMGMEGWLRQHDGRQASTRFIFNWLRRAKAAAATRGEAHGITRTNLASASSDDRYAEFSQFCVD